MTNAAKDIATCSAITGDIDSAVLTGCETMPTEKALHPGRQQMVTSIATLSFFEMVFNEDPARRAEASEILSRSLPSEMPEASYTESAK